MARTSAKAKKQKQDENKNKNKSAKEPKSSENEQQKVLPVNVSETSDSTDKENDDSNFEVEKIIHTRLFRGKRQYLIRWKGYKEDADTWENESVVQSCTEVLDAFKRENPTLNEKSRDESDGEAEDEGTEETESEEEKGRKRTKKETKVPTKKLKKTVKSSKVPKKNKEHQQSISSESEEENKETNSKQEKEKITNKGAKKVREKKVNETVEHQNKKVKGKKASDDESITDGKNYEVEKIIEVHSRKDGSKEFLIRWKGYRPSEDTWEPEAHLDCRALIDKFMEKVDKAKSIPARELRVSREPTNRYIPNTKFKGVRNLRNPGFRISYQE